jgi:hypothetical protein
MRNRFSALDQIFDAYYYLRMKHENPPTNYPAEHRIQTHSQPPRAELIRSFIEDEKAFMGDVGKYFGTLPWYNRVIMVGRYPIPGYDQRTWQRIVSVLKRQVRRGKHVPAQLHYYQNVRREFFRLENKAIQYFRKRGFL